MRARTYNVTVTKLVSLEVGEVYVHSAIRRVWDRLVGKAGEKAGPGEAVRLRISRRQNGGNKTRLSEDSTEEHGVRGGSSRNGLG